MEGDRIAYNSGDCFQNEIFFLSFCKNGEMEIHRSVFPANVVFEDCFAQTWCFIATCKGGNEDRIKFESTLSPGFLRRDKMYFRTCMQVQSLGIMVNDVGEEVKMYLFGYFGAQQRTKSMT